MEKIFNRAALKNMLIIALCFLLTSTGWLSWEYHLLDQIPAATADICTMVIGYLLQAAGIGVHALIIRKWPRITGRILPAALILHLACMFPAVLSPYIAGTLVFGLLMNFICGIIAGGYLCVLTQLAGAKQKATVFGIAYGVSILLSWLLSVIDGGSIYYSGKVLIVCAVITAATVIAVIAFTFHGENGEPDTADVPERSGQKYIRFLILACILVFLFSVVNSSAFAFPAADLGGTVSVELSRLVYAAGLIIAGVVTDRNRKYGAICALSALIIPFIILALKGSSTVSVVIFWALSYFAFGFYAVFRVILLSDIAAEKNAIYLAAFGLMVGRAGDAAGEGICLLFSGKLVMLIIITAILFMLSVAVFFMLYQTLYIPEVSRIQSEKEHFARFSAEHDLSSREKDLLRLILEEKTVAEIADALSISENTVKYHVKNILQKTGYKTRKDLVASYQTNNNI